MNLAKRGKQIEIDENFSNDHKTNFIDHSIRAPRTIAPIVEKVPIFSTKSGWEKIER